VNQAPTLCYVGDVILPHFSSSAIEMILAIAYTCTLNPGPETITTTVRFWTLYQHQLNQLSLSRKTQKLYSLAACGYRENNVCKQFHLLGSLQLLLHNCVRACSSQCSSLAGPPPSGLVSFCISLHLCGSGTLL